MIHELHVDTVRAGQTAVHAAALPPACQARWVSEFGFLNQVFTLIDPVQPRPSPAEADAAVSPVLEQREVWSLKAVKPWQPSELPLFELREYTLFPGRHAAFVALMLESMKVRERYSTNHGIWVPLSGNPDRVFHLWAYRDLAHRGQARAGVAREPGWKSYTDTIIPMLRAMRSTILLPLGG